MATEIRVLGELEVRLDGCRLDTGHARQQCVLAALLVDANRAVAVDALLDRVWGERPPQRAPASLHSYLSRLRGALAGTGVVIVRRTAGYVLTADPHLIDLHRFRRLVAEARAADDDQLALDALEQALGLWRGEPFTRLEGDWLQVVRAGAEIERHSAELDRADLLLRRGRHAELVADLSKAAAAYPLDERLTAQLMLALYRDGRQADALRCFEGTRRRLASELGADPAAALRRLHHRILTADPTLQTPGGEVVVSPPCVPMQLPAAVPAFVGRDQELAWLDGHGTGPVVICGMAGVGKSSLAVHWAHRVRDRFPDGQLHIDMRGYAEGPPRSAAEALAGFLSALGVPGSDVPSTVDARAARFRSELAGRRVLMVVDNAREPDQIRPLLPGTPACLALVTSRDAMAGLVARDGARRLDLYLPAQREAVTLLRKLVGARVDAEPGAACTLADRCGRLPLALRVAAELATSRPGEPLSALTDELTLATLDAGGDDEANVAAVFSWSYRHLPPDAARVFRRLGLHPGDDLDQGSVAALDGTTDDDARRRLNLLARANLIQPVAPGRYRMHDLLRAYAQALVAEDPPDDRRAARTRILDHYLAVASKAAPAERDNLIRACAFAADHGWEQHAVGIAAALEDRLQIDGDYVTALAVHGHARRAARRVGDVRAQIRAATALAEAHLNTGQWADLERRAREAHTLARRIGDRGEQAEALLGLSTSAALSGRFPAAFRFLDRALGLLSQDEDQAKLTGALLQSGYLNGHQGRPGRAVEQFERARRTAAPHDAGDALLGLGWALTQQGDLDTAATHLTQALNLFRKAGGRRGEADALIGLGDLDRRQGRLQDAHARLAEATELSRRIGNHGSEFRARTALGATYRAQGRLTEAADSVRAALDMAQRTRDDLGVALASIELGRILTDQDHPEPAAALQRHALAYFRRLGNCPEEADAATGLGDALHALGDLNGAQAAWTDSLAAAIQTENRHAEAAARERKPH
ncbi:AfsR/SARP family transcriptional regulator [Paractinoplanes rishiriensis]|uniref:XRE family transcriptional regulator n=1 Tax=Paractinoplanes rishiriensis TaxID=1050105 RepID=A0A919MWA4_9ACTN|nr:BTAD domain-containing putative transcriptional regulator [Actinoplanes rishiriensis]GIF02277.1 XRE family transcriptional regulator [Actinoplanes rishiriensis]